MRAAETGISASEDWRVTKLLLTGDLHLGRGPSGLPSGVDVTRYSATVIWGDIVDLAISEGVSAVLLSGDIVDRDNRFAEAYGPLERGVRKLTDAGIHTVAIAGNHDFDVLPALADRIPTDAVDDGGKVILNLNDGWRDRLVESLPLRAIVVPRVVPTAAGAPSQVVAAPDGRRHVVRLLTYLPGTILEDVAHPPQLLRNLGATLARLGRALRGFFHPAAGHELLWDLKLAARLREAGYRVPGTVLTLEALVESLVAGRQRGAA